MTRRIRASRAAAWGVGCVLGACAPEPLGRHVEFVLEDDSRALCAGTADHLERFVERTFEFFGSGVPGDFQVPVRVVAEADFPCEGVGCYRQGEVFVARLDSEWLRPGGLLRHELSHAVVARVWGQSSPFFSEGLATALPRIRWGSEAAALVPVGEMLELPSRELDYAAAGEFVRFLIETRGLARFERLFRGARGRTKVEVRGLIEEVYGESFAALEAEYVAGEPGCWLQIDVCDSLAAEPVESEYHASLAASCHDPEVYGSVGAEDETIATQRTIELGEDGAYRVRGRFDGVPFSGSGRAPQIALVRCGACDEQFVRVLGSSDEVLELSAGMYTFEVVMPFDAVVTIDLERVDG